MSCCSRRCWGRQRASRGDADPAHRHVVRLTSVRKFAPDDPTAPLTDPLTGTAITEIAWAAEDALPFPLCISAVTDSEHGEVYLDNVSVARGNIVLADHGLTSAADEALGSVPAAVLAYPPARDAEICAGREPVLLPPRFSPQLANAPLTFAGTVLKTTLVAGASITQRLSFDPDAPAAAALVWRMEDTLPAIELVSDPDSRRAALGSAARSAEQRAGCADFVVEVEDDGSAQLRFGDDVHGRRPKSATAFTRPLPHRQRRGRQCGRRCDRPCGEQPTATCWRRATRCPPAAASTRRATPSSAAMRPQAFRRQERAVTPADYEDVTERHAGVQRAAATLRWTGSWHTVFITVDRLGGLPMDDAFEEELTRHVERYRMAGHDTEFNDPVYVPLELELLVCVQSSYFRADVKAGLLQVLSDRVLPDGRRGLFHPDNLSFGQTVFLSPIYAAARQVAGVGSVQALKFQRQGIDDTSFLADGIHDAVPAGDRAPRQRPQLPRARRAALQPLRRQVMSDTDCGCCAGLDVETPARIDNPPGQSAIAYRVGRAWAVQGVAAGPALQRRAARARRARRPRRRRFHHRAAATRWRRRWTCSPSIRSASPTRTTCARRRSGAPSSSSPG